MPEAIPLGLGSAALVARAHDLTSRALRTWSERWAQEATVDVTESEPGSAAGGGPGGELLVERLAAGSAGPAATLWWPAALEAGLARALFGAPLSSQAAKSDDTLAARSVHYLASELRRLLAQAWRVEGWLAAGASPGDAPSRWHAPLDVRVTVAGATLVARVPALRLRPSAVPGPATPLTRAQTVAAFGTLPSRATAVIGQADISVAELANIQCGDVLLLDALLSDPLQIEIGGAPSTLRAGLGLVGTQRAVQFISNSRP